MIVKNIVLATLVITAAQSIAEKRIKRSDLPPAVQRTADAESLGATVVGYVFDKEGSETLYELLLMVNGHTRNVTIDPNGKVVEVEEQVEINALPTDVVFGLRRRAGEGKIIKVESLTKHGKLIAYEAQVESRTKHVEVQVGPNGEDVDRNQ